MGEGVYVPDVPLSSITDAGGRGQEDMRTASLIMTVMLSGCGGDVRTAQAGTGAGGSNATHAVGSSGRFAGFGASTGVPAARGGNPPTALDGRRVRSGA